MYTADYAGRVWLDQNNFVAPFGHFPADYEYVVKYLRYPQIKKRTYYDGLDEKVLLRLYAEYLKSSGLGWIGFHGNEYETERRGYVILQTMNWHPLVYSIHGGIDPLLWGKGIAQKMYDFATEYVFEHTEAQKLEGYICRPNRLIEGYFKRGGMELEHELSHRITHNGNVSGMKVYGLTKEKYHSLKEN